MIITGTWKDNQQIGEGRIIFPNGRIFEGTWDTGNEDETPYMEFTKQCAFPHTTS